jgi:hypothetical protein
MLSVYPLPIVQSQFEISVRYLLAAILAGIFTAGVIYIYMTYR